MIRAWSNALLVGGIGPNNSPKDRFIFIFALLLSRSTLDLDIVLSGRSPDSDGRITTAGVETLAVGGPSQTSNDGGMSPKCHQLLARQRIPQAQGTVVATTRQGLTAGGKGDLMDECSVTPEGRQRVRVLRVGDVPSPYLGVATGSNQHVIVGRETERSNIVVLLSHRGQELPRADVPDSNSTIATRGNEFPVARERGAAVFRRVVRQLAKTLSGDRIPEFQNFAGRAEHEDAAVWREPQLMTDGKRAGTDWDLVVWCGGAIPKLDLNGIGESAQGQPLAVR